MRGNYRFHDKLRALVVTKYGGPNDGGVLLPIHGPIIASRTYPPALSLATYTTISPISCSFAHAPIQSYLPWVLPKYSQLRKAPQLDFISPVLVDTHVFVYVCISRLALLGFCFSHNVLNPLQRGTLFQRTIRVLPKNTGSCLPTLRMNLENLAHSCHS